MKYAFKFSASGHEPAIERAERLLSEVPGGARKALLRAVNRAMQEGRTAAVQAVTSRYQIRARDVRPTFHMKKARLSTLEAELSSSGEKLELRDFKHTPKTDTTGANRKRVRVAVERRGGLKPLGQAFIYRGHIFSRTGKKAVASKGWHKGQKVEQIEKKFGLAVPQMVGHPEVSDAVANKMREAIDKRLDHEVNRILKV